MSPSPRRRNKPALARDPLPPVDLRTEEVTLWRGSDRERVIHPRIIHNSHSEWDYGAQVEHLPDAGGISHEFELVVERAFEYPEVTEREWLDGNVDLALDQMPSAVTPDRILLARLQLEEFPVHIGDQCGWYDWFDGAGDERMLEVLNTLQDGDVRNADFALYDGALIWLKELGVHPAARGQQVGLRLMGHALWQLHRTSSDVAVLQVGRIGTPFDKMPDELAPGTMTGLVRYYQRLGFKPWKARQNPEQHPGLIMYLPLSQGLRARGAGELTRSC